jgi:hypothetical protein
LPADAGVSDVWRLAHGDEFVGRSDLLDRALEVSGERSKKAVVAKAIQEFSARRERKRLIELMGQLEWDDGFDYKAERSRR